MSAVIKKRLSKDDLKEMREKGNQVVKGVFRSFEPVGGALRFSFRKFPGDPVRTYQLEDGKAYELPRAVAEHLQQNCWYPIKEYVQHELGTPFPGIREKRKRFTFESLEFVPA